MKKSIWLFIIISLLAVFMGVTVFCEEAQQLDCQVADTNFTDTAALFDSNRQSYITVDSEATLTIKAGKNIEHLYIEFDLMPEGWEIVNPVSKKSYTVDDGFLHQYVNISEAMGGAMSSFTLTFPRGTSIADIYFFSEGELPSWVQTWSVPCDKADIMLVSAHSDDEHLFFAGVLPYYAIERQLQVQVVYSVQHFSVNDDRNHVRPHEQLDGLWTVGVRSYPVMTDFPDVYSESTNRNTAFTQAEAAFGAHGITYDDFCSYLTECIRRFKPLVVITHGLDGEYGHGTHVLCASAVTEAIGYAADAEKYPESYEKYGSWQVEKTYLHQYEENKITMDWDTPYDSLGGKTPFQVTQDGFRRHQSQHWCWFYNWLYGNNGWITKATQITHYSPCDYGLYDSRVGQDVTGGDFMENVIPWSQREQAQEQEPAEETREDHYRDYDTAERTSQDKYSRSNKTITLLIIIAVTVVAVAVVLLIAFLIKLI
ncbi:MAG: PIG-L family deacetylase [Clostridia bacterium]|nr:PIG-L family deacetylase [Clostridia bacterium]